MRVTFGLSFQEVARNSGRSCSCRDTKFPVNLSSLPQAHSKACAIATLYKEWQAGCLELWGRVKHIVVKRKGSEVFEDYPGQIDG